MPGTEKTTATAAGGFSRRPRAGERLPWLGWQAVTTATLTSFLVFIHEVASFSFYTSDKQVQYMPVFADIGRRLRAGEFPNIDPDLGVSGNYALDVQYGLFEPTHWIVALGVSSVDNLATAAWVLTAVYLLILGTGVCATALRLGAQGAWAAAAGFAVATSGYTLYWLASTALPGLISLAWMSWWCWALAVRRPTLTSSLLTGLFAFLTVGGGWPATWLFCAAIMGGIAVEAWTRRGHGSRWSRDLASRVLASTGGALAAAITVMPLFLASDYTTRESGVSNDGFMVPNLADVIAFASPTLQGDIDWWSEGPLHFPIYFGIWFAAVVVWIVPWDRRLLLRRGVVTGLAALVLLLLLTQAPSDLGPIRHPFRMVSGVHFVLGLTTVTLLAGGRVRVTRHRVLGAVATALGMSLLSWFRVPGDPLWLDGTLLMLAATAVVLIAMRLTSLRWTGIVTLAVTAVLTGWVAYESPGGYGGDWGYAEPNPSAPLPVDEGPALALYRGHITSLRSGVGVGFGGLTADARYQPGYSSIQQKYWVDRFDVRKAQGYSSSQTVKSLFETESRTGKLWIDLLGYRTVLVRAGPMLDTWRDIAPAGWRPVASTRKWTAFQRTREGNASGRVTAVLGQATVTPTELGRGSQAYRVRSVAGATLVFRDLFWPGYVATLGDRAIVVAPYEKTLVSVKLPPGTDGVLTVKYDILPASIIAGTVALGLVVVAAGALVAPRRRAGGTGGNGRDPRRPPGLGSHPRRRVLRLLSRRSGSNRTGRRTDHPNAGATVAEQRPPGLPRRLGQRPHPPAASRGIRHP